MFARPDARHSQVAYVTNDIEAAAKVLQEQYGVPGFWMFSNRQPGVEQSDGAELKIGLSVVGGVEIEIIEPIGDTAPLFKDVLPGGPGLALRFHHICSRIHGPIENWNTHVESIDFKKHPIAWRGQHSDQMRFIYTDERATLGHYVEHVWLGPQMLAQMQGVIPTYPATK
jgi:hypothetical protein